ncbi:hypothetical protein PFICI_07614 [Pestalotiopsis fici W106-1]|uniref:Uncharacterized protein n=1 Tax=Pestalotiopsis fici (strain W106-1 / CGMCC3.15140) TaxID=1229662 RepID=W3X1Y1_PESFW|nr:uncharacterized protein PFICI_07614 [Pestalotiopsis fici W106-1]ETS80085.1 hypothetical protein PFICI_07614 [Pestalotiopsis fici W106-1]
MPAPTSLEDGRYGTRPSINGQTRRGRPRTRALPDPNAPKRPRGRPRKGESGLPGVSGLPGTSDTSGQSKSQDVDQDSEDLSEVDDDTPDSSSKKTQANSATSAKSGKRKAEKAAGEDTQATRRKGCLAPFWLQIVKADGVEQTLKQAAQASVAGNIAIEAPDDVIESVVLAKNGIQEWHDLWVMMLNIFQSTPYDLFTWGLRESDKAQRHLIYRFLGRLLPHPMWEGDLSRLRYALQKAISLRVAGHLEPLGPLPLETAQAIVSANLDYVNRAALALSIWHSLEMDKQKVGGMFLKALRQVVESEGQDGFEHADNDKTLFQLSIEDIQAVHQALDSMRGTFSGLTVASHHELYSAYRRTARTRTLAPENKATLERWDRWSLMVRQADEASRQPDYPQRDRNTYKALPYWDSNTCDVRFWHSIHSDISSIKAIEVQDDSKHSPAPHSTKKVKIEDGVIDLTQDDDDDDVATAGIEPPQARHDGTGTSGRAL